MSIAIIRSRSAFLKCSFVISFNCFEAQLLPVSSTLIERHRRFGHFGCCQQTISTCSKTSLFAHIPTIGIRRLIHLTERCLATKDFYKILNISKNATAKDIKQAYYERAKKFHPDRNKGDKAAAIKFAEIAEAYEILGDEDRRREYDMLGAANFQAQQQAGGQRWNRTDFSGQRGDPEDLFRRIFEEFAGSDSFSYHHIRELTPIEVYLDLTFNEAVRGANKAIHVEVMDTCPRCKGRGNEEGTKIIQCGYCGGTGTEQISTGPFVMSSTCRRCEGTGKFITQPCPVCDGVGRVKQMKSITVAVPAGIDDRQTVRMQVETREVFITFRVSPSHIFQRKGADIHSDATVSFAQAALGGTVKIPGIHEQDIELTIPPGTDSHRTFVLPKKGVKKVNSYGFGDHHVHVKIRSPSSITPRQKQLLLEYSEEDRDMKGTVAGSRPNTDIKSTTDSKQTDSNEQSGYFEKLKKKISGYWK